MSATMTAPLPVAAPEPMHRRRHWERYALAALLIATALAYVWGLGAAGWANSFYSAAAQAGSVSWKAFLFGSSDAANSITVDKPPASLWLMALSVRLFGLSSWSILLPQALLGVGSVALLWATVRRYFGAAAGLLSGLVLALTPVAVLMFRFNNPDALLVFLMIGAAWAMLRGVEDGRTRWLVVTGVFVGFGFLTKQLAVMLVVPPLALTYLLAGPPKLGKRVLQLLAAGAALVASAGWWLLMVELWPTSSRPWIGGSQNNSILELTIGYNGLGRLDGNERGSVVPGGGEMPAAFADFGNRGTSMWGSSGITRMFEPAQGGQIAWLIPAALILMVVGIALRGRVSRTDTRRASFVLWGGWLLVTGLVFSFMAGIFHSYYTVALAPAVAALVGSGAVLAWQRREKIWVRVVVAATLALTGVTAWILLNRSPDFVPWLRWVVAAVTVIAVVLIACESFGSLWTPKRLTTAVVLAALFVGLAGPTAYAAETVGRARQGAIVSAGPNVDSGFGFPGGPGGQHRPRMPGDGAPQPNGRTGMAGMMEEMFGGAGNLLMGSKPSDRMTALLEKDGAAYTWVAATVGANSAAGYQLATELPVMPIGGFNGTDPSPTLDQFKQYVADGKVHYFIAGGMGRMGGGEERGSSTITQWVEANFTVTDIDGVQLYDLTTPK
jgi:4-amino-4-deoxy-L-arabinose transferase-like glycosyltransferase